MKILAATNNPGKLAELQRLINLPEMELLLPENIGLADFDVEETGSTFYENASLKAVAFAKESHLYSLADDSGLQVDALNGEPGVYSKRYAGENATDPDRIALLLKKLENVPSGKRSARFIAVLVLADPEGNIVASATGYCEGEIGYEPRGQNGFGYDPIFLPSASRGLTMAEISDEEKDRVSHRGDAARKIAPLIKEHLF